MKKFIFTTRLSRFFAASLLASWLFSSCEADMAIVSVGQAPAIATAGDIFTSSMTAGNVFGANRDSVVFNYVLSYDSYFSSDDLVLASEKTTGGNYLTPLTNQMQVSVPTNTVSGIYYLLRSVYSYNYYEDLDPFLGNNTVATSLQIFGQNNNDQDLIALNFGRHWDKVVAGDSLYHYFQVKNFGNFAAPASKLAYYLSTNPVWDAGDKFLGNAEIPALGAHQQHSLTDTNGGRVYLPIDTWQGVYYLFVKLDNLNQIPESNEDNNMVFKRLYVFNQFEPASLIENPDASDAFAGNMTRLDFEWVSSRERGYDELHTGFVLSKDRRLDLGDRLLGRSSTKNLSAGKSRSQSTEVDIPADVLPGEYWLLFVTSEDAEGYSLNSDRLPPAARLSVGKHLPITLLPQNFRETNLAQKLIVAPNPASGLTTVSFCIADDAPFSLDVFNPEGKEVKSLDEGERAKGNYQFQFDVGDLPAGAYRVVLRSGGTVFSQAMVVQ